ncbi:hypothetical protein FA10DRAFT_285417 [Acaromyces ingoldii]|uniref:Pyridoxamine 5'-phosphate oxidase N-terminal domain-containing protein n=1 Tax=Acaromyces ingoldii TaxID=215250 RepID=A0A316YT18_9BASI|nr:hypothetical protein FA10DRAFT_285417 [Acaromyces ingoldii]PWN92557.1 hypothetical protein FA10DRAFT_285417 [Acaromyces ingoldii]
MVVFYDEIPAKLFDFIERQPLFFVATAPLSAQHRVNLSPKSATGCFELVGPRKLRYLDLTGSGNETISHLNEVGNGRITVMFVNLEEGAPNIVRMYGRGTVHERFFDGFSSRVQDRHPPGTRALIEVDVAMCSTSCGFSVPIYAYLRERQTLAEWARNMESWGVERAEKKYGFVTSDVPSFPNANSDADAKGGGDEGEGQVSLRVARTAWEAYLLFKNARSIDDLPGLVVAGNNRRITAPRATKGDLDVFRPTRTSPPSSATAAAATASASALQRQKARSLDRHDVVIAANAFCLGSLFTILISYLFSLTPQP